MSHIASHIKIKSIRCVECCLSFDSKESLMTHLRSSHSQLPGGICIDVGIENHERRRLQCKTDILPNTDDAALSGAVSSMEKQWDGSKNSLLDSSSVTNANCIKLQVSGSQIVSAESDRCSFVSSVDDVESGSSILMEDIAPANTSNNNAKDAMVNLSGLKTCQRKLRKPSQDVVNNTAGVCMIEIAAAMLPMSARCPHCTFTCNTALQLKVRFRMY